MATAVKMPRVSKVATTAEIVEWLKRPGDAVQAGEPLLRVLSEKATVDIEAPAVGVLLAVIAPAGREVAVGALLGWIGQPGERVELAAPSPAPAAAPASATPATLPTPAVAGAPRPAASPAARRLARQSGVNLSEMVGSGPAGLITRSDVQRAAAAPAWMQPAEGERITPLTGYQRVMIERMTANVQHVAQATTVAEVDVTDIMGLRQSLPATLTAWVILAAARALAEYPILNASLRAGGLAYHDAVHMGVSVETDAGLLVPVIRNAQARTLAQINAELERLVRAARDGSIAPEEMAGATFTVTNSGVLGSVLYTPMIVPPQSAILGMGRAAKTPVVRDDQIVVRTMMYLSLSYDHRHIAGAIAVRYLQRVRAYLENPLTLAWNAGA
jgi:pyruvate/2-oxoglutarate dehydrogenase complex dihydrolipoamide acyltransferase (E2) component